jgi:hypothetical protein
MITPPPPPLPLLRSLRPRTQATAWPPHVRSPPGYAACAAPTALFISFTTPRCVRGSGHPTCPRRFLVPCHAHGHVLKGVHYPLQPRHTTAAHVHTPAPAGMHSQPLRADVNILFVPVAAMLSVSHSPPPPPPPSPSPLHWLAGYLGTRLGRPEQRMHPTTRPGPRGTPPWAGAPPDLVQTAVQSGDTVTQLVWHQMR